MRQDNLIQLGKQNIMNTYSYFPLVIEKGEGCYLWDTEGNKYLDFVAGIAVNCLGYKNEEFISGMTEQLQKLNHCSNLYYNQPQIELADMLVKNSHFDKVFFCNSGAEAIEAALKLARKYGKKAHGESCYEIITMNQSFHGRTFGAITATGQEKYQKGLNPLLPGILHAPYNDFDALKQKVTEKTCAILVEPIQGEGGIRPADKEFLQKVRELCTKKDIVLIYDEVQCGVGRTGKLFGYENYEIPPDVIALAKGLGGGFPIGAMMAVDKVADSFKPGDHASTFGGNPLACTAGKTVLNQLLCKGVLNNAQIQGNYLREKLECLKQQHNLIVDVRGLGLMQGIELNIPVKPIIERCINNGLLLIGAGEKVIRFVPPLIITNGKIDEAMNILSNVLNEVQ